VHDAADTDVCAIVEAVIGAWMGAAVAVVRPVAWHDAVAGCPSRSCQEGNGSFQGEGEHLCLFFPAQRNRGQSNENGMV
jgi:hypothetical protein